MTDDVRYSYCTVKMDIHNTECGRPAVLEITNRGRHVGWRCKIHTQFDSVHNDMCMIDDLKPVQNKNI